MSAPTPVAPPVVQRTILIAGDARWTIWLLLGLRLLRSAFLFAILCSLTALSIVAWQEGRAAGWGLNGPLPDPEGPAMNVPSLGASVELDGLPAGEQAAALHRLAAAGIGWVRLRVDWSEIEPERSRFEWKALDGLLEQVTAAGLEAVFVLDNSPRWARDARDVDAAIAPPHDSADYAAFLREVAGRYAARVRFYQVWDEPNIAPHWGNRHIDPVAYAQLLRSSAEAIRSVDADSVVITAALAPTNDRGHLAIDEAWFLKRMIAAGAASSFDAVAAEPFGFGDAPATTGSSGRLLNFQRLTLIRRTLLAAGLGERPVWAARFGWNTRGDSPWSTVTPANQIRYVSQAGAVASQWPWLATLGWAIDQPAAPRTEPVWGFALSDDLLSALAGPFPAMQPAGRSAPARQLLFWLATALIASAVAWSGVRGLPCRQWLDRWNMLPAWSWAALWGLWILVYHYATWPPLIAACWLAGALLMTLSPTTGIALALISLPFTMYHKEVALGGNSLAVAPHVAAVFMLAPVTLRTAWRGWRSEPRAWRGLLWSDRLALAWAALALLASTGVWNWAAYAASLLQLVLVPGLLYLSIRLFARGTHQVQRMLASLFLGGLLAAGIGLAHWGMGEGVMVDGVRRLVGPHYSPNHTALYLVRSLFLGVGLALAQQGRARLAWLTLSATVALALLLTASRGALLLGLPAGLLICAWLWWRKGNLPLELRFRTLIGRPAMWIFVVAIPIVILAGLLLGEARLLNTQSVDARLILWRAALRLALDFPVAGVGPGGFYWRYPAYLPLNTQLEPSLQHPHNVWLETVTGWGVLGLVWLAALLAGWLTSVYRRLPALPETLQWPAIGLAAAFVAGLAHAQVDAFLALPDLAAWLFAALALHAAITITHCPPIENGRASLQTPARQRFQDS